MAHVSNRVMVRSSGSPLAPKYRAACAVSIAAGFASTSPAARQLVSHGHIQLNGRRVTIPSIRVRIGDAFGPSATAARLDIVKAALADPALQRPEWIAVDAQSGHARLAHLPDGETAAPFPLDLQRVVEYYATRT
jgi:small subunit ribosomal protein S4